MLNDLREKPQDAQDEGSNEEASYFKLFEFGDQLSQNEIGEDYQKEMTNFFETEINKIEIYQTQLEKDRISMDSISEHGFFASQEEIDEKDTCPNKQPELYETAGPDLDFNTEDESIERDQIERSVLKW